MLRAAETDCLLTRYAGLFGRIPRFRTGSLWQMKERSMKGLRWALVGLGAVAFLSGCKGFWDAPTPSPTPGSASGTFYVLNQGRQQVAGFAFASGSSTPAAVTNGSATFAAVPLAMTISPNGGFLYVSTGGGIFASSISSSGALTLLNNNQAISSDLPTSIAVDGSGSWLLESTSGSGVLNAIPVDASTGIVDSTRTLQTFNLPNTILTRIVSSPGNATNPYIFVAMGAGGTEVIPFTATSTTNPFGTGGRIAAKSSSGGATSVAVDPTNRLFYVTETVAVSGTQTGGLRVFTIGTNNTVKETSGSPYPTGGTGPSAILPTPDGNFVYVANKAVSGSANGNISGYPIVSSGGVYSLGTLINTIAAGVSTVGLAEDNTKTYVLAVNSSNSNKSPDLNTYTFDTTTSGKLVAGSTAATGTDPAQATAIVAVP
jgi:6-phosphogluconolactonase (cycloisomerase 2 family)